MKPDWRTYLLGTAGPTSRPGRLGDLLYVAVDLAGAPETRSERTESKREMRLQQQSKRHPVPTIQTPGVPSIPLVSVCAQEQWPIFQLRSLVRRIGERLGGPAQGKIGTARDLLRETTTPMSEKLTKRFHKTCGENIRRSQICLKPADLSLVSLSSSSWRGLFTRRREGAGVDLFETRFIGGDILLVRVGARAFPGQRHGSVSSWEEGHKKYEEPNTTKIAVHLEGHQWGELGGTLSWKNIGNEKTNFPKQLNTDICTTSK